jgi:hypothetical protein
MTPCFTIQGFAVDVIRRLWDRKLYQDNKWLKMVHANWFNYWVEYRTCLTMQDVDAQIEELLEPSEVDKPIFTEEEHGETPLGGPMELRAPWLDDND